MNEKEMFLQSIKDFLTPKMLRFSVMPFLITLVVMYVLFFTLAGMGVEQLGTMQIESSQTTIQNGVPHTESLSAQLEDSSIIKFLMSYTLTSWLATFLIYTVGGFLTIYLSVFIAVIVIGFLTPFVLKELQARHYKDVTMTGHSNPIMALFLALKWIAVMLLLFLLFIPLYFIPLLNIVAINIPLYYFFHKMLTFDIASNICTKEESRQIGYFSGNKIMVKTAALYLLSLVPFVIFFTAIFFVIYLGHTYFSEVKKIRA
ncbi:MAG: EI24 domain-containing protein [Sulfurimonas sp.]|uniref:EI24 domain-containing protein n=1 Tax=Sulfurimonas sp. TaxID=2022749 RepID=UPI002616B567|nr:EI24 domain-containing protein [Sulfurimonas sp.]MDD2652390.1 EI24 domain-containing protein [Sulfurimonas sp.]MDD3451134.1 EI24 domain-containing protein [Sulfurimonas sp.]